MMQSWALFDFCLSTLQMPFPTPVGRKWSCLVKPYEEEKFFIYLNVKTKIKGAQKVRDCGIPLDFFFLRILIFISIFLGGVCGFYIIKYK